MTECRIREILGLPKRCVQPWFVFRANDDGLAFWRTVSAVKRKELLFLLATSDA